MAISNFQSVTLPILRFTQDCQEHSIQEIIAHIYILFDLLPEEISQLNVDGSKREIESRIRWAISFLKKGELIMETKDGCFRMTELGMRVIKQEPLNLDLEELGQLPAFVRRD